MQVLHYLAENADNGQIAGVLELPVAPQEGSAVPLRPPWEKETSFSGVGPEMNHLAAFPSLFLEGNSKGMIIIP